MKIVKVRARCSFGFANAEHNDVLEIEIDETGTQEEIDDTISAEVYEWAASFVDYDYDVLKD